MGVKVPGGDDPGGLWTTLSEGLSRARLITAWDATDDPVTFACEVKDLDLAPYLSDKEARRLDRVSHLGWAAAADALADAGSLNYAPDRSAVIAGSGIGGQRTQGDQHVLAMAKGLRHVTPFLIPMVMPNATAGLISVKLGWRGPSICLSMACATGAYAIGEGLRLLRDGTADVVIAGGTDALVDRFVLTGFARAGALSRRSTAPAEASRPFDADRDGFVMGEGAAFVVLERLNSALERGARVHAVLSGYGRNSDAHHVTEPSPNGAGAAACMQLALEDAGLQACEIGHVNAHGTSTPYNDRAEAEAIAKVFGPGAVPVTSAKGVIGHLMGGAGSTEIVASVLSIQRGLIPPTANFSRSDAAVEIDVVADAPRVLSAAPVISNSFAFGGHNAALVIEPAPAPGP